jgi:SAM-dependent methyltransferase
MALEFVYEQATSLGIVGLVLGEGVPYEKYIQAFEVDGDDTERLISQSHLFHYRADVPGRYGTTSPARGFNLPFAVGSVAVTIPLVRLRLDGAVVGEFRDLRAPENGLGVDAHRALGLSALSFFGVDGYDISGGIYHVHGVLTPPGGDYGRLRFVSPKGVSAILHWPIHAPGAGEYYWYVPGTPHLAYRIDIDLADSKLGDRRFLDFRFEVEGEDDAYNALRTVTVPLDLARLGNMPPDFNIRRVQNLSNRVGAGLSGLTDARRIATLIDRHYQPKGAFDVLDWGCGFGRVARFLVGAWPGVTVHACDIDARNMEWLAENPMGVVPVACDISGRISAADASMDVVYGISVMTHLRLDVQRLWIAELARVTKDGGLLLLTIVGASAIAFASRWKTEEQIAAFERNGTLVVGNQGNVDSDIGGEDYYVQFYQTPEVAAATWAEHFEFVEVKYAVFGYQDVVVCRRKRRARG